MPNLVERFVEPGSLQVAFGHLPNEALHPMALQASTVAACASRQGQFWAVHDALFREPKLTAEVLDATVAANGLDDAMMSECLGSEAIAAGLRQGVQDASRLGIAATPSLLLGLAKDDKLEAKQWFIGVNDVTGLEGAIRELGEAPG